MIKAIPLVTCCVLVGCTGPYIQQPSARVIQSNAKNWEVVYSPLPKDIPLNELFEMRTRVIGAGVVNSLSVDAGMPSHGHGMMTQAVTVLQEDGSYLTSGMLLHMPGEWELYFDIDNGDIVERAQDSITLEP